MSADSSPDGSQKTPAGPGQENDSSGAAKRNGRTRLLSSICFLFLAAGVLWLGYWYFFLRLEASTDNAYVAGNLVRVSPQVSGSVSEIMADNTQAVKAGQTLLRLDDTDACLALERARSLLADTVRRTRSLMAESSRLSSVVELRKRELEKARGDLQRRQASRRTMAVSEEDFSHARDNLAIAEVALQVARQDMRRNRLLLQDTPLAEQPPVRLEAHRLREAWLAWRRCEIKSPVDGFVARRTVQVGMQVTPGTPLLAVVPLSGVWVDANFKEVDLAKMRIGQPVLVRADIYGRSVDYRGSIIGFSAGTGSSFSLLPPENATGNWIKVVQRVPVRIALDPADLAKAPLLVGLSCTAYVNISDSSGAMLGVAAGQGAPLFRTDILEHDLTEIDAEINAIIAGHAGE